MRVQVKGNIRLRHMWDRLSKRPRRYYLGRREEAGKWEELLTFAREYRVSDEEVREYLEYYLDEDANTTKAEYVLLSLSLGVELWGSSGGTRAHSGRR